MKLCLIGLLLLVGCQTLAEWEMAYNYHKCGSFSACGAK